MSLTFDASDFLKETKALELSAKLSAVDSMQDSVDDLKRISQNIAPIDKSTLRKSANAEVKLERNNIVGEVTFRAVEDGFNYAIWTHEADYTPSTTGGTDGYTVGNKYLERPLKGESEKYVRWWQEAIGRGWK